MCGWYLRFRLQTVIKLPFTKNKSKKVFITNTTERLWYEWIILFEDVTPLAKDIKHIVGKIAVKAAQYLRFLSALYIGYCFRRCSASLLSDLGAANLATIKSHGSLF